MKTLLKNEEFQKKLLEAIKSGKYTDYYFDGEDECLLMSFYEYTALENVLKVLAEELEDGTDMGLFKAPYGSIIVTPYTELEDARELFRQYLETKITRS